MYTSVIDFSGTTQLTIRNLASGGTATTYWIGASGQNSASFSLWNSELTQERLLILKGTENLLRSNRLVTSGIVRPTVFQMHDSVVPTMIEAMRIDISGNVELNRSGGTVQFKSGNTSLTKSDTAD